jgi:Flp pilus assembly pilin Flp
MRRLLAHLWYDRSGAAAIEYGLIASLIVLTIVAGMTATGTSVSDLYRATLSLIAVALST